MFCFRSIMNDSRKEVDDEGLKCALEWEIGRIPQEIRAMFARRTIPNKAPGYIAHILVKMMRKHLWRIDAPTREGAAEGAVIRSAYPEPRDGP